MNARRSVNGRAAILLIGGDKTGDKRFYENMIPIADRLYVQWPELAENVSGARFVGNVLGAQ